VLPRPTGNKQSISKMNSSRRDTGSATGDAFPFDWFVITTDEFLEKDYCPDWLVVNAIIQGQPLIMGGPPKAMKTSLAVDLAISLASATPWLGKFAVPARRRVAILSGESGPFSLQETARRICRAKGVDPVKLEDYLQWQFHLPQLASDDHLTELEQGLEMDEIEVAIIDPLYLSLLSGSNVRAENVFEVGPLLLRFAQFCKFAGATPILLHHTTKTAARQLRPLELTDLAYSGFAEFARQWLLVSRREEYDVGSGIHQLWLAVGGSVGHGGLYHIDIDEGRIGEDFSGRTWNVIVATAAEVSETKRNQKEAASDDKQSQDEKSLLDALDRLAPNVGPAGYQRVRELAGLTKARMSSAFERLIARQIVIRTTARVEQGNGAMKKAEVRP
jgi:hypothetical protein